MVSRTLEGTLGKGLKRVTVRQIHQFIKVKGDNEEAIQLDTKIQDMNKQTLYLFGASQEIIRYVLFCHQDESNWLFSQNKDLKKIFDRIFDTEKFSKMMTKMISLKKAYKLRQIEVRAECDANREKFELMIGSMKEMQRNIKSLKENLHELEKEKQVRKQLQSKMDQHIEDVLPVNSQTNEPENPENLKIKLETKLEYERIRFDELEKDVNYRKDAMKQNEYINYNLEELKIKIEPYEEKIQRYEAMNTVKNCDINDMKKKMDELDIGSNEDAQILKQKVNIVKSQILETMGKENVLPINIVIEESKAYLEVLKEENSKFSAETKSFLKPWDDKIQKEELNRMQHERDQKKLETMLEGLKDKVKAKENIYKTEEQLETHVKKLDLFTVKFKAKQNEMTKLSAYIQEIGTEVKKTQKKIQNVERQKDVVEYMNLKKDSEKMYELLMIALNTTDIEIAKNADAFLIEKKISESRDKLRIKEKKLKDLECNEIVSETHIGDWKAIINTLRSEIVNIEIEMTKLDSTLTTEDILLKKYKILKEEKKSILDALSVMNYIKTGENVTALQEISIKKQICKVCYRDFKDINEHNHARFEFGETLKIRESKKEDEAQIAIMNKKLEEVDLKLAKLKPHKDKFATIEENDKRILELTELIEKETKIIESKKMDQIKLRRKNEKHREQIKSSEDVQNLVIDKETRNKRMKEIEKTVNVENFSGVNLNKREEFLKSLKKDLEYNQEKQQKMIDNQQAMNKELDGLRLERGDLIMQKSEIELNLKRLRESVSIKDEGDGPGSQVYTEHKIKEECEEMKMGIVGCDFELEELKAKRLEKEQEREVLYSKKRQLKNDFEDKIQTLELNYEKLMGSNPDDQIKIKQALNEYSKCQSQIQKLNTEISQNNQNLSKTRQEMKSLKDCIQFKTSQQNLAKTNLKIKKLDSQLEKVTILVKEQAIIGEEMQDNQHKIYQYGAEYNAIQKAAVNAYNSMKKRRIAEVDYFNSLAEQEYIKDEIEEIDLFMTGLEESLQIYHEEKIEEVNNNIKAIWDECYKGKDITRLEIKTKPENENATGGKKKNFDYRVVFYQNDVMLDMRGRSSAGQRVLASIVIRIALAETFANNTGVMALDEPTTNLDQEHIELLSQFLGNMINARKDNDEFQLIIITHDQQFISMLKEHCQTYYNVYKGEDGFSQVRENAMSDLKIIHK